MMQTKKPPSEVATTSRQPAQIVTRLVEGVQSATRQLASCTDIGQLHQLDRRAAALLEMLRGSAEHERAVLAARLKVQRRMGELLAATVRAGKSSKAEQLIRRLPKGVGRTASHRCQRLASIPRKSFDAYVTETPKPTMNGALRQLAPARTPAKSKARTSVKATDREKEEARLDQERRRGKALEIMGQMEDLVKEAAGFLYRAPAADIQGFSGFLGQLRGKFEKELERRSR